MDDTTNFRTRSLVSNETRLPDPEAGEVMVVSKYGKPKAVVLHPDDFEEFLRYRRIFGSLPHELRLSETAIAVHRAADRLEDVTELDVESVQRALS